MGTVIESKEYRLTFEDIPLYGGSINIINYVKNMYTEEKHDDYKVIDSALVHLYPLKDTRNEDGELDGFSDALIFETKIYDPKKLTYSVCQNDSINTSQATIKSIKIFKDGSTMIELDGEYRFSDLTSLSVYKPKKSANLDLDLPINPFD